MKSRAPFSWGAVFLSPLPIPLLLAAFFGLNSPRAFGAFWTFLALGYIATFGAVAGGLIPGLWMLGRFVVIKGWMTVAVGTIEGFLLFFPWDYISWGASGVDSGPPADTYLHWLVNRSLFNGEVLIPALSGAFTAAAYHFIATRKEC